MNKRILSTVTSVFALTLLTASAFAGSLDVEFTGVGRGRGVKYELNGETGYSFAGQLVHQFSNGEGDSESLVGEFITYCTELSQFVAWTPQEYELTDVENVPNSNPMGAVKAQAIFDMFAHADGAQFETAITTANRDYAAAFQVAIWEVVTDFDGDQSSLDITASTISFSLYNENPLRQGVRDVLADLFGSIGIGADAGNLVGLSSDFN